MHPTIMNKEALSIGDVAREAGVNVQTLRYYERRGLVRAPQRSEGGHRQFGLDTVRLVRFIKRAQELGFTLKEIEELIALRQPGRRDRSNVRRLATAKLADVDEKIGRLRAIRTAVAALIETCTCAGRTLECPIIEALDDYGDNRDLRRRTRGS